MRGIFTFSETFCLSEGMLIYQVLQSQGTLHTQAVILCRKQC